MTVSAIVLAAGMGVRMKSKKPKVLHAAAGRPMIDHVLDNLFEAGVDKVRLVLGHGADQVKEHLGTRDGVQHFIQREQRGTADAVKSADVQGLSGIVMICNGDHPLIKAEDYKTALEAFKKTGADLMVVSALMKNPAGFGRIVKGGDGRLEAIVEEKDATPAQRKINEVNTGLYVVKAELLKKLLPRIKNNNAKKEFYVTDMISLATEDGQKVEVLKQPPRLGRGVNTQSELAMAAKALYLRKAKELMDNGVVIVDPTFTYVTKEVSVGAGTVIYPGCFIEGKTKIGTDCVIESHCRIKDADIGNEVEIRWGTLIEASQVKAGALVGPYARLRPESTVGEGAHIGNFVELKKAVIGDGAKANHLTYLGDCEIGEETNIGCGTITCNYAVDKKKYKTKIGKNVFVGSDTQFIAPVTVGDNAVIGSGSTITKDVPADALAVARGRQVTKENYNKR